MMPLFWYVLVCSLTQSFEVVITAQLMSLQKSFGPTTTQLFGVCDSDPDALSASSTLSNAKGVSSHCLNSLSCSSKVKC